MEVEDGIVALSPDESRKQPFIISFISIYPDSWSLLVVWEVSVTKLFVIVEVLVIVFFWIFWFVSSSSVGKWFGIGNGGVCW